MVSHKSAYDLAYGQEPLPLDKLPQIFTPGHVGDLVAIEEIRQRMAYYLLCCDGNAFEHLDKVFVNDAIGFYSEPLGSLNGLQTIQAVLKQATSSVKLQHMLSTQ